MEIDASKKKDGDDEAEALWYEYLGDWSKLRRKNIHAAVLALAAVRAQNIKVNDNRLGSIASWFFSCI